jgi:hypothetical protein
MVKALEINAKHVADAIRRLAENSERELESIVAYGAKQMAKKAQRGFNRALYDGTNDVYCYSVRTTAEGRAKCTYNVVAYSPSGSVAFIEFGAGMGRVNTYAPDNPFRETVKPAMAELGHYGKGRGSQDFWIFKNKNISMKHATPNLAFVVDRNGNPKPNVYWTGGNKPARAMWGAKLDFDKKFPEWVITVGGKTK